MAVAFGGLQIPTQGWVFPDILRVRQFCASNPGPLLATVATTCHPPPPALTPNYVYTAHPSQCPHFFPFFTFFGMSCALAHLLVVGNPCRLFSGSAWADKGTASHLLRNILLGPLHLHMHIVSCFPPSCVIRHLSPPTTVGPCGAVHRGQPELMGHSRASSSDPMSS